MSNSLQLHEQQHARLSCPSLSPEICSNSCPLSQLCHPTIPSSVTPFFSCLQSFPGSGWFPVCQLFIRWSKYWSFSISPSTECSGLISLKIDWFHLFAVQGTLKSLLQHHSLKASFLQFSSFFVVQFSHLYMTTGKVITLIIQIFVGKVMSLFFNMLPQFVIACLPGSKHLLILWLQSLSTVTLEPKKIKSATVSTFQYLFAMK